MVPPKMSEQTQQLEQPVKKKGRGGARPNSGPKKGVPRKRPMSFRERFPTLPLEHLLGVLNTKDAPAEEKFKAAVQAAPYIHPRLAALQIQQFQEPQHSLDLTKLTDEELIFFERILAKAQITHPVDKASHAPQVIEHDPGLDRDEIIDVTPEEAK